MLGESRNARASVFHIKLYRIHHIHHNKTKWIDKTCIISLSLSLIYIYINFPQLTHNLTETMESICVKPTKTAYLAATIVVDRKSSNEKQTGSCSVSSWHDGFLKSEGGRERGEGEGWWVGVGGGELSPRKKRTYASAQAHIIHI